MLVRVAIGLEWNRLDDWFLGAARDSQLRAALVPLFPEVHDEVQKLWKVPLTTPSRFTVFSTLTTLDGGARQGLFEIPQVERAIAMHLCPQSAPMTEPSAAPAQDL